MQERYCDSLNRYSQQDYSIIKTIQECIYEELQDSILYEKLSKIAPDSTAKDILYGFSKDEKSHADALIKALDVLSGISYMAPTVEELQLPGYYEAIRLRVINEADGYRKYEEKFLKAQSQYLKDLFFAIGTDEARHAMILPVLINT